LFQANPAILLQASDRDQNKTQLRHPYGTTTINHGWLAIRRTRGNHSRNWFGTGIASRAIFAIVSCTFLQLAKFRLELAPWFD